MKIIMENKFTQYHNSLDSAIDLLGKFEQHYKECNEELKRLDQLLSDYDHKLELDKCDAPIMMKIISNRRKILFERRIIKDEIEIIEDIKESFKHTSAQALCDSLKNMKSCINKTKERHRNRQYLPRTDYELFGYTEEEYQVKKQEVAERFQEQNNKSYLNNNKKGKRIKMPSQSAYMKRMDELFKQIEQK